VGFDGAFSRLDVRGQRNAQWQVEPVGHYAASPGSTRRLANQAATS
jgi:hypothetical protein